MSIETVGVIGIVLMLLLMFLRMPIGVAMAVIGFVGFSVIVGWEQGFSMVSQTAFRAADDYMMIVIPLFILMGIVAGYAGLSDEAFYTANKWLGHLPGGLAMAVVGGCTGFGAVCGSAVATASTMCMVALPEMRKYNYSDQFSLGTIACGGMLGFMIPPSIPFMLYGILTGVSIGSLFIAGIIPGLLIAALFIVAVYITCRFNPRLGPTGPRSSWRERALALYHTWGILVLFILVLGGMYGGFFTPSEAGAIGAFGALVLGLGKRQLTWKNFIASLTETGRLTGMVFMLIIGSMIFGYFMAVTEVPFWLANYVGGLPVPAAIVVVAFLVMYIILGFFVEIIAVMVLTVPILYPVLQVLGVDPVWFGVLVVLTVMIGQITPPVGVVVFAVGGLARDVPLFTIFRGTWPYFYAMLIALVILVVFPQISLWLPSMMRPGFGL